MSGMKLDDNLLTAGGVGFVGAAQVMTTDNVARPTAYLPSLTGIGGEITYFLKGVQVARAALADAARTGSESVAAVMKESGELDTFITTSLGEGFAVQGQPS